MMNTQPEIRLPVEEQRPIVDMASYKDLQESSIGVSKAGILSREDGDTGIPPLDSITVTTSSESNSSQVDQDDAASIASTCSSVSCDLIDSCPTSLTTAPPPPRSIFPTFWKSEGLESCPFRRVVSPVAERPVSEEGRVPSYTNGDYQQLLQEAQTSIPTLKRTRRNIFGLNLQDDTNNEDIREVPKDAFRKTKSAPTLGRNHSKLPSALRQGKYSHSSTAGSATTKASIPRSVSFNEQVSVQVFHDSTKSMLVERWAANGWDQLFH